MRKRRCCFHLAVVVLLCCLTIYFPILLSIRPGEVETWNMTRNVEVFVQPRNYTAIIGSERFCHRNGGATEEDGDDIFLLIVVCSAVSNLEARQAIRETWASAPALNSPPRFPVGTTTVAPPSPSQSGAPSNGGSSVNPDGVGGSIRVLFLLGRTNSDTLQQAVLRESQDFGDIVQEDFLDTYNNLTLKSVMMLKWVNNTCRRARFVMKTDDDTFVNIPRLASHLQRLGHRRRLLLGCLICGAVPVRNKNSKWYVPRVLYNERYYPNYLSGTGYVISNDLIAPLYDAALDTPFFHLEDIYVTGLCAQRLGVRPADDLAFTYQKRPNDPCLFHFAVTGHRMTPADMHAIWKAMLAKDLKCDSKKVKLRDYHQRKCA